MNSTRPAFRHQLPAASRCALAGALAAALLFAGTGGTAGAHDVDASARIQAELVRGNAAQAIVLGEAAVAKAPQTAPLRALLGHAYLRAGRFESAAAALHDALELGDSSDRTVLSLALAQIACGQNPAALATLERTQGTVSAADLGLALALAGDTGRGIAVLTDAVRDGTATPKLRQNLAYAYALDGRWADAQLTAGFDLPPDQVQLRLQQWAESMQAGGERNRIARLLNVPVIADQGMPAALALNGATTQVAVAPAPQAAPAPQVASAKTDAKGELLPLAPAGKNQPAPPAALHPVSTPPAIPAATPPAPVPPVPASLAARPSAAIVAALTLPPVPAPAAALPAPKPTVAAVMPATLPSAPPAAMTTPAAMTVHPVAATWPTPVAQWLPPVNHPSSTTHHTPVAPVVPGATQGHVIQLGAFTSAQSAERAKSILAERNPQLRGHSFMITQATVNGHAYWRVVTSGFDRPTAQQTCANLKRHGGACFAYAADHAPQGETLALANTRGEGFGGVRRHR